MALLRRIALVLSFGGLACRPTAEGTEIPGRGSAVASAEESSAVEPSPVVLEPSPYLQLLRLERQAATGPLRTDEPRRRRDASASDTATSEGEAAPEGEAAASEGSELDTLIEAGVIDGGSESDPAEEEVRTIVVRTSPFATEQDVYRYLLRKMDKKPRLFNPTRALTRQGGRVTFLDDGGASRGLVRSYVRAVIRESRPRLEDCIFRQLAEDPRVMLEQPSGLVFEQALTFQEGVYRFSLDMAIEGDRLDVRVVGSEGDPTELGTRVCIGTAMARSEVDQPALDERVERVELRVPVVVFIQGAAGMGSPHARMLSMQAAVLGWLHYERGEYLEARESFRDAAWAYRLPEYQVLLGRAEEALGRPRHAIAAYRKYVDERAEAPDASAVLERIEALTQAVGAAR